MKSFVFSSVMLFLSLNPTVAQDTTWYYSSDFGITENSGDARYKRKVESRSSRKSHVTTYELNDRKWVQMQRKKVISVNDTLFVIRKKSNKLFPDRIKRTFSKVKKGLYAFQDTKKGSLIMEGMASKLVPLHLQDTLHTFYPGGSPKSVDIYKNNRLVSNQNWLEDGTEYFDDIFYFVEEVPNYNRGQSHFRAHILNGLKQSGIDLTQITDNVVIGFTVMKDSKLAGFHVISGVYKPLNQTLIELIKTLPGKWIPAQLEGHPVRYHMTVPFNFINNARSLESLEYNSGIIYYY